MHCPVCGGDGIARTVERASLPIFQNVVYETRQQALDCPRASFSLGVCDRCGFSFNAQFDPELIVYDERYDNHVASATFKQYYRDLATMLIDRFALNEGTVYDIGCGNGEFLRVLCELAPGIRGVGIDPSCQPLEEDRIRLVAAPFSPRLFDDSARLVVCRHVVEHIDQPVAFLAALRKAMPNAPLFVEVPDLDWILENNAFWDFCYEHCNYFTLNSLAIALGLAGFTLLDQRRSFGDQYQWAVCMPASIAPTVPLDGIHEVSRLQAYRDREAENLEAVQGLADREGGLVLWGMATKGVILSNLIGPGRIIGGIDMNPTKQSRFAAGSGVSINAPQWLNGLPPGTTVIAMNGNYRAEIADIARGVGAQIEVITL